MRGPLECTSLPGVEPVQGAEQYIRSRLWIQGYSSPFLLPSNNVTPSPDSLYFLDYTSFTLPNNSRTQPIFDEKIPYHITHFYDIQRPASIR